MKRIYRLVVKLRCESQCRSKGLSADLISTDHAAQGTATMITVAAVEIDQVNSRIIVRSVADRYYGLLC